MGSKKQGYKKGDVQAGSPPDLNDINFKNKDVVKWSDKSSRRKRNQRRGSGLIGLKGWGVTKVPRI
ncbi:MAG: hypothetical protein Unbinned1473contig1000_52 [Prokaryotic dsDNA virus sp.]|nr:MAG: hypothetical protein Unbinned1473contig1000_52 [Prokaryotic dsDNA virus sp.]|tara:strand:- start:7776 stop:7973 length:198 start_codon:yes stop_codon:yes gene_type:complete